MFNIRDLVKSAELAAGAALLYIATFCSPVYAQDAPKSPAASQAQELEKKAKEGLESISKVQSSEDRLKILQTVFDCYKKAEDLEPGEQYSDKITVVSGEIKSIEDTIKTEKAAAAKVNAESLVKKAEDLFAESQKTKTPQEQLHYIKEILSLYDQAESQEEGEQYKKKIEYFKTVLANVEKQIADGQKQPQPADPSKQPGKTAATADPQAGQPQQPVQKTEEGSISSFADVGGRIGINHTTHNDGEYARLKIGDFLSGKAIYDEKSFQSKEELDINRRTYAATARLSIPGLIAITATGDNTEEHQRQFMTQTISDPSFDVTTDTYVRATDANQFMAAMLELGPIFDLSLETSVFDHQKRIITHINQVTYVKNKTLPNGDYADGYTADERSYVDRMGWQAILKHMIECKGEVPFAGQIGLLFDYEKTRIDLKGSPIERILSLHLGMTGKVNVANYLGITFIGAQQYLDAPGTNMDNWPSVPFFAAGAFALPNVNLATLVNEASQDKFNANVTIFGAISYLLNRNVGGRLGGVVSFGYDKAPIDFLNNYFERIGKNTVGLRRELSDALIESETEIDARMIPFDIHPPKKWSFLILGQGGVGRATNLNNEDVQTSFGSLGALLRMPYVSIGGMGFYSDNQNGIDKGFDMTLQLHKLGEVMLSMGAHVKSSPRMKDDIIEAQLGLIIRR